MTLILEVTGSQAARLGAARRKVFDATGGTIGRLRDNYWPLPDPYVSSRHAVIRYENGTYYIEDTSTNGVFVNGDRPENRLVKGQRYPIQHNDWIFIEPYEIRASIETRSVAADPSGLADLFAPPPPSPIPAIPPAPSSPLPVAGPDEEDWFEKLGPDPSPRKSTARSARELHGVSPLNEHFRPPEIVPPAVPPPPQPPAAGALIPDDYDPFKDDPFKDDPSKDDPSKDDRPSVAPPPSPPPSPPSPPLVQQETRTRSARPIAPPGPDPQPIPAPASRRSRHAVEPSTGEPVPAPRPQPGGGAARVTPSDARGSDALAQVLRGAGIDPSAVTPEFAADFGRILRLVVGGVMDVLQARQRIKSEFRMDMTTFRPADNNPLKFSANVDDALHNLLVKRNAAYLNAVDAFDDAFDDIRNHQMAMLAGMRVAFEAMLGEFDPEGLQAQFDRQMKGGSLISVPAKMRYWDLYAAKFRDMVKDPDAAFRVLFGDEFAAAYEEQLKRLKARSRDNEQ